jgi:LPXTG-site transpeptidase (sortase) family protein
MQRSSDNRTKGGSAPLYAIDGFFLLVKERPLIVGGTWFVVFALLITFSYATGIMPTIERDTAAAAVASIEETEATPLPATETDAAPVRIIIDAIGVDTQIMNPTSRDIDALDEALTQGVVHYPGSGDLDDISNLFLLGHSTGFRVVNNNAYKVFNDLKRLEKNDVIRVLSEDTEHLYRVTEIALVNATETSIPLESDVKRLTLATCNVFGAKEERYVVSAEFVGSYPLATAEVDL